MAWIPLTTDALKELMAGAEYNAVTSAAKNNGQDAETMVENALARIVKMARGFIGRKYNLGEEGTIPDEVEDACLDIARVRVLTRLPALKQFLTKERTEAAKSGEALLRSISRGDFVIVESPTPSDAQPAQPTVKVISTTKPKNTHAALGRLF